MMPDWVWLIAILHVCNTHSLLRVYFFTDQLFQDLGLEDESHQQEEVISKIKKAKTFFGEKVTLAGGSFSEAAEEHSLISTHFDYKVRKLLGMEKINRRESLVRKFKELDGKAD